MSFIKFFYSLAGLLVITFVISCKNYNTVQDSHFDDAGHCLDSVRTSFSAVRPTALDFYVEVSGSMNGFFRSNQATRFKKDVWSVVSDFGENDVSVLANLGNVAGVLPLNQFRAKMNQGGFVSNQETLVPTMIGTILNNLDYRNGQCAVLISDMKYSPEKQKDVSVLLTQYQSDIRNQIGNYPGISVCMILATSEYLSAGNLVFSEESPYYYVIFGRDDNVAFMRNCIATLLEDNGDYCESIEMGFDYKSPAYSFGIPNNCVPLMPEPTFIGFNTDFSDTCTVKVKIDLTDYRWIITDEDILRECISVKSCYGSMVSLGDIIINVTNHNNREFERKAEAMVEFKIYDMIATESDVIEWTLNHPDTLVSSNFTQVISCPLESDLSGPFSVDRFIYGVFNAIQNKWDTTPNRILISKIK